MQNNITQGELSAHYDDNGFYFIISNQSHPSPYVVATGAESSQDEGNAKELCKRWNTYPALVEALKEIRADLFYQLESKFGAEKARQYPSIFKADTLLETLNSK